MTNYDIDEFIFPRYYNTKYHEEICKNNQTDCKNELKVYSDLTEIRSHNFNIYQLAKELTKKHGSNSAFFEFAHFLVLNDYNQFYDLLREGVRKKYRNKTSFQYNYSGTKLRYSLDGDADFRYAESLVSAISLVDCLNKTFLESKLSVLDPKWTRTLATVFNNRAGKSIFNTEYTLSINQHYAENIKARTKNVNVNKDYGYVSHVRDGDIGSDSKPDNVLKYSIQSVRIDVEYLYFIVKIAEKFV